MEQHDTRGVMAFHLRPCALAGAADRALSAMPFAVCFPGVYWLHVGVRHAYRWERLPSGNFLVMRGTQKLALSIHTGLTVR